MNGAVAYLMSGVFGLPRPRCEGGRLTKRKVLAVFGEWIFTYVIHPHIKGEFQEEIGTAAGYRL